MMLRWLIETGLFEPLLTLMIMAFGFLVMLGRPRVVGVILGWLVTTLIIGEVAARLLPEIPLALLVIIIPVVVMMVLNALVRSLFGAEVAGQVVGVWIVRILDSVLSLAFAPLRLLFSRRRR